MNIGIICEYNPFHYGHIYHINEIKKRFPNSNIILVMSGIFTQRGELSLIDKFKKSEIALKYGVDLVVELPFKYIQSADFFAKGAMAVLNKLKVDKIVFGSESNTIDLLMKASNLQLDNKEFDSKVKEGLKNGLNYPTSVAHAIKNLCGLEINTPNDILGICYIKEILKNKYNIVPLSIKRENDYNSKEISGKITSATSIRELIKNNKKYKKYVPKEEYKYLKNSIFIDDYFDLLKYKIITSKDLTIYQGIDENLSNRILRFIDKSNSLEELINNIKSKNYTYNRIKRTLLFVLFSITKDDCSNLNLEYIRVLGFNDKGKKILNNVKKDIDIPLLTKFDPKYLYKDLEIKRILSLNNKIKDKQKFIESEYKEKIRI